MTTENLGNLIRETRVAQGLRQEQLAAAAGVGLRFLIELERGKPTAQIGKTLGVLAALGCRVDITPPSAPRGKRS
jgi:y4mF family transcriptional regulator